MEEGGLDQQIIVYKSSDGSELPVKTDGETVWLTQEQMCKLFGRTQPVIARHIANIFKEGELEKDVVYAKFAYTTRHGAIAGKTQVKEVLACTILMSSFPLAIGSSQFRGRDSASGRREYCARCC